MPSPVCTVNSSPTLDGVNVTPSSLVTIQLASTSGVNVWSIQCVGTDDLHDAATITASLSINSLTKTATFTCPADNSALLFQSKVNNGFNSNGVLAPEYTARFEIYTVATDAERLVAANETTEGNAQFGWVSVVNNIGRTVAGGVISGDTKKAVISGAGAIGDLVTTANDPANAKKVTLANPAAVLAGTETVGILIGNYTNGQTAEFATLGSQVDDTITGLAAGSASWGVLNTSGRVVRKDAPESNDLVVGSVTSEGHLITVSPFRPSNSEVVVTHPPFNAKNDASADASDAIRAALAAAQKELLINGSSRAVRIPAGDYLVNKPIHVKYDGGSRVYGEGNHTTNLRSISMCGPVIYVAPDRGEFPHDTNVFAGGSAIRMRRGAQNDEHWLPIGMFGAGHWFHGKSAFCIRAILKVQPTTTTATGFVAVSIGRRLSDEGIGGLAEGWGFGVTGTTGNTRNRAVFFTLTTTAGILSVYSPTDSLTADGIFHEIECNWSAGQMRIFIDGIAQTLNVAGTLAGTIVQKNFESATIGGGYSRQFNNREFDMADVDIASFAMDDAAIHTTGYTPNGAKLSAVASTTMHCNFDTYDGIFVVGTTRPQTNSSSRNNAYWPHRQDQISSAQMPDCSVENMYITATYGVAVGAEGATRFTVRNVECTAKNGIRADNNCYISTFENIKCVGSGTTQLPTYGISLVGAANVETLFNIATQDYDHHMLAIGAGDMTIQGYWYPAGYADIYLLAYNGFNLSVLGDFAIGDEASPTAPTTFVALITMNNVMMHGGQFGQSVGTNAGPLVTIQGEMTIGGVPQPLDLDVNARMGAHTSCPGLFKVLGTVTGTTTARGFRTPAVPICTSGSIAGARVVWEPHFWTTGTIALSDADKTLTRDEHMYGHHEYTGTLTATRTMTWPAFKARKRSVYNATGQTLTFKLAGGAVTHNVATLTGATFAVNAAGTELVLV